MLYFALFPGKDGNFVNEGLFQDRPSRYLELLPDEADWDNVIRVIDLADMKESALVLNADSTRQRVVCYMDKKPVV